MRIIIIALISMFYGLHMAAAAGKDLFAEPKVHSATLMNFLPNDCSQRISQLTIIQTFASNASKASITRTVGEKSIKDADLISLTVMSNLNTHYIKKTDLILTVLAKTNKPLHEYICKLTEEHPESQSFLIAWSTHQLSKIGSELFEDKE